VTEADVHTSIAGGLSRSIGAKNPIPPGEVKSEIAVGFPDDHRMMHPMHFRGKYIPGHFSPEGKADRGTAARKSNGIKSKGIWKRSSDEEEEMGPKYTVWIALFNIAALLGIAAKYYAHFPGDVAVRGKRGAKALVSI